MNGGRFELELILQGSYYVDVQNTDKYGGQELVNFRVDYPLSESTTVYARLMNVLDRDHTAYTSGSSSTPFRPGAPRSLFVGCEFNF